jgi:hypothetical protein
MHLIMHWEQYSFSKLSIHVTYEAQILNSADHTTNKDVSSCVCTQVLVLLSGGYKLHSVKVLHFLTQPSLLRRQVRWSEFFHEFDHKFD